MIIIFSTLVYYAERNQKIPDGSLNKFTSIPATFWWCIETLTTVGYGDMITYSLWGRIIAAITMFTGLLFVAMPSLIITRHFEEDREREERFKEGQYSLQDIHQGLKKQDEELTKNMEQMKTLIEQGVMIRQRIQFLLDRLETGTNQPNIQQP